MRRCSSCNEPMRDTDDHCIACEQWDLEFERQREAMHPSDDHDTRYMDYYSTREGDSGEIDDVPF